MPNASRRGGTTIPRPILLLGALLVVVAGLRVVATTRSGAVRHPEPRVDVTAAGVLPSARYASYPRISGTYDRVREIPQVLDGLYCYCHCNEHSNHRSLLSCFESDHGAGCDICLEESELAYRMHTRGESLQAIRAAIDAAWGV